MAVLDVFPILDGEPCDTASGQIADVINPATGEIIGTQRCCSSDDVDNIVRSSQQAFESDEWRQLGPADRGNLLLSVADLLEQEAASLVELELLDTGKPISQLRDGEISLSAAILRFYAGAADKVDGAVKKYAGRIALYELPALRSCRWDSAVELSAG